MLTAWQTRFEPIAFVVTDEEPTVIHERAGDAAHRFSVRDPERALLVRPSVYHSLRPSIAAILTGRRVGYLLTSVDDVPRLANRLAHLALPQLGGMEVAVGQEGAFTTHPFETLVTL